MMKKRSMVLCAVMLAVVCLFAAVPVGASSVTVNYTVDGAAYTTAEAVDGKVTLPAAPAASSGVFVGWTAEIGGEKVLYPAGATVAVSEAVTFDAVLISYATCEGASVRVANGDVALRFLSEIAKSDYDRLVSLVGDAGLSFGTYIVASEYLAKTGNVFTLEALAKAGYTKYLDVEAGGWYDMTANTYRVAGSVAHILDENYTRSYSGTGYIKVTYSDGSVGTVYSGFTYSDNARNIYKVVLAAYNDRSPDYAYVVPAGTHGSEFVTHSPYNMQELDAMKIYLDSVAAVKYSTGADGKYVYTMLSDTYYTSIWRVSYDGDEYERNTVTITASAGHSISEIKALLFGGARLAWSGTDMTTVRVTESTIVIGHSAYSKPY